MCLHKTEDQAIPQAGAMPNTGGANPVGAATGTAPSAGADPLSQALSAEKQANPDMASVSSPTKFGKLMKILAPALEGAVIGGATGKSTYGGGFAGATQFFANRRQQQLTQLMMDRQQSNDVFHNALLQQEAARQNALAVHTMNQPNYQGRSILPTAGVNAEGKKVFFARDPISGEPGEVPGFTPADKDVPDQFSDTTTDQGIVTLNHRTGEHKLATLANSAPGGAAAAPAVGGKLPTKFNSGSPARPGAQATSPAASPSAIASSSNLPTTLTRSKTATKENDFEQYYDQYIADNNLPDSAKTRLQARAQYEAAGRRPEKPEKDPDAPLVGAQYRKVQSGFTTQLNNGFNRLASERARAMAALSKQYGGQENIPEGEKDQIEQDNASAKQDLHQRLHDEAQGQGVDIGEVPDYSAQLNDSGGGTSAGVPRTAPGASKSTGSTKNNSPAGGKTVTSYMVGAWAAKKGITLGEAQKQFNAKGYKLIETPEEAKQMRGPR